MSNTIMQVINFLIDILIAFAGPLFISFIVYLVTELVMSQLSAKFNIQSLSEYPEFATYKIPVGALPLFVVFAVFEGYRYSSVILIVAFVLLIIFSITSIIKEIKENQKQYHPIPLKAYLLSEIYHCIILLIAAGVIIYLDTIA